MTTIEQEVGKIEEIIEEEELVEENGVCHVRALGRVLCGSGEIWAIHLVGFERGEHAGGRCKTCFGKACLACDLLAAELTKKHP